MSQASTFEVGLRHLNQPFIVKLFALYASLSTASDMSRSWATYTCKTAATIAAAIRVVLDGSIVDTVFAVVKATRDVVDVKPEQW